MKKIVSSFQAIQDIQGLPTPEYFSRLHDDAKYSAIDNVLRGKFELSKPESDRVIRLLRLYMKALTPNSKEARHAASALNLLCADP